MFLDGRAGLLSAQPVDVGRVGVVPGGHVLLHAGGHAGLLAARERASGLRYALFETVLLEFLDENARIGN